MIGIVGGVGPFAGVDIVKKIIEETIAVKDQDHLPVLLSSQPHRIADRTKYLVGLVDTNPAYALAEIIQELAQAGATVVAIPCNTAHAPQIFDVVKEELQKKGCKVKLLNLIEETANYIKETQGNIAVGVLSTTGTKNTGLYRHILQQNNLQAVEPDDKIQETVHAAIYDEKYGIKAISSPVTKRARQELITGIGGLKQQGAQAVVLGCTELPLALPEKENDGIPLIDPNRILARALIKAIAPEKLKPLD